MEKNSKKGWTSYAPSLNQHNLLLKAQQFTLHYGISEKATRWHLNQMSYLKKENKYLLKWRQ